MIERKYLCEESSLCWLLFTVDRWKDGKMLKQRKENQAEKWESHDILFVTKQWHGYSEWGSHRRTKVLFSSFS